MQYLEKKLAEQSNQVHVKNDEVVDRRERLLKLEGEVSSLSVNLRQPGEQKTIEKDLFDGVNTTLASQKTSSR